MCYLEKFSKDYGAELYLIFRVIVGVLFAFHGSQKLLGWFGGGGISGTAGFFGNLGIPLAGVFAVIVAIVEFGGGIAIALGLFTRLMAILGTATMIAALALVHFPKGWMPLKNGGELPLLFIAAFLVLLSRGAQKYSLEKKLIGEEMF
ncbi:MAG TPA: DoxX family protein [Candidatus Nanoarchaeia archaeon]|nr:DoxX family protein [Candidatus Nanoarchaeia archaeon]